MSSDTIGPVSLAASTIKSTEAKLLSAEGTSTAPLVFQADAENTALNDKFISDTLNRTAQAHQADGLERATKRLEQLDSDSDGFLTREELQNLRNDRERRGLSTRGIDHLLKHFDLIDVGGDRKISAGELEKRRRHSKQVESSSSNQSSNTGAIESNARSGASNTAVDSTVISNTNSTETTAIEVGLPTRPHDKDLDELIAEATKPALAGPKPEKTETANRGNRTTTNQSQLTVDSNVLLEPIMGTLISQSNRSDLDNAVRTFLSFKSAPKDTENAVLQASGLKTKV